jgi:hypothetical protein
MTFEKINNLLLKYFDGDTSLEEENILRGYFSSDTIDERLVKYAPLFNFLKKEKEIKISAELNDKIEAIAPKKRPLMQVIKGGNWWKIAATIAFLIIGSWAITQQFGTIKPPQIAWNKVPKGAHVIVFDENSDPSVALAEIEKALRKASKTMKKGTDETTEGLQKVKSATKVFNQ